MIWFSKPKEHCGACKRWEGRFLTPNNVLVCSKCFELPDFGVVK